MLLIGLIIHYPQQILRLDYPSLFAPLGLTHYAVERVLLLVPVVYAGMIFGLGVGMGSLAAVLAIMLPRLFLSGEGRIEAAIESGAIVAVGVILNIWFDIRKKENRLYRHLAERLEAFERGLSVSEQKYHYLFENASDAIWVQDVNGLFVDGNRAFEKLTGFKREELRGVHLAKFLSSESLKLAREIREKLVRGEPFEQPYEQQFSIKDGSVITVKMSTNAIMAGGRITGFEHVARDVTAEKKHQESVLAYIQQITRAQEEERKRIARDLHDDVSPDILILIQKLDGLISGPRLKQAALKENLGTLRQQAVKALESLRRTAQGLRPRILDDLGLTAALEWIAEELEKDLNIKTNIEVSGIDRQLTAETQVLLFRIAQEALNNIRKHAHASQVSIEVNGSPDGITMVISDDGQGFQVPERAEGMVSAGRLGLMGMYERARLLGGTLHIRSTPGKGTEITVKVPWHINGGQVPVG